MLADVLTGELFDRHVELVTNVAPKRTKHLVVEFVLLAASHQFCGFLQSFGGHLVSLAGTLFHDIGILDGSLTEDDEERDEAQQQQRQAHPIFRRGKEELVDSALKGIAGLDVMDVAVQ